MRTVLTLGLTMVLLPAFGVAQEPIGIGERVRLELLPRCDLLDFCIDQLGLLQTSRLVVEGGDLDGVESFLVCDGFHEPASCSSPFPRLTSRQIMLVGCKKRARRLSPPSCSVG